MRSLLRSSALRLALKYTLIYAIAAAVLLGATVWYAGRGVDDAVTAALVNTLGDLDAAYRQGGHAAVSARLARHEKAEAEEGQYFALVDAEAEWIAGSFVRWPGEADIEPDSRVHQVWIDEEDLPGVIEDQAYWPAISGAFADGSRVLVAQPVEQAEGLREAADVLIEGMDMGIPLMLLMGITLALAFERRMRSIDRTAASIMAGDLGRRVPVSVRNDEFDNLARRLNSMLERIQQLVRGIRTVTDNIAHDLRTPLTRLRNRLEVALLEPRSEAEYREELERAIEDAAGLIQTFNALLSIAQVEAGNHRSEWDEIDLRSIVDDLVDLYRPLAEERGQDLRLEMEGDTRIVGSRDLLAPVIGNLIDNAIKYTPVDGVIDVAVRGRRNAVELTVADSGPGIPAEERERVFERFVRLDASRGTDGNGLGLSLVRAAVRLHQAELTLDDNAPGLIVRVRFPRD